jgi:maleylacetate reductase
MELNFVYVAQPSKVFFGRGSLRQLPDAVNALGARRALVICGPEQIEQAQDASELLGDSHAGVFAGARMHVPLEVAHAARQHAAFVGADCLVSIGGGSTVGLAKAIALDRRCRSLPCRQPMPVRR